MPTAHIPSLYQVNTRVWLTDLGRPLGRPATLDDIPDAELDQIAAMGFDWVWLLSVWQTGEVGQQISRTNAGWRSEFIDTLPDLSEADIPGSGFAIAGYTVASTLGGDAVLARLRERLRRRGLKLLLDFVPNHTAIDHPWVEEHPEFYIAGTESDLTRAPGDYMRVQRRGHELILARGRDPFFPGWPDVLQLNYGNPAAQEAMIGELLRIAAQCDGVRCDMAMLILPDVFERTWGLRAELFWPKAIGQVRERFPEFCWMAEVYWDREWDLQQQGFDYTYDKRLYDRLHEGNAAGVRAHFCAGMDFQSKLVRFLENHDEPRAAAAFPPGMHQAAAAITYLAPGLRFFHQGQFQGRRKRISPHLGRGPDEPIDRELAQFYDGLLTVLREPIVREGRWQLLECLPAWEGNGSNDAFVACAWEWSGQERMLVAVNYAAHSSQGYLRLPFADLAGKEWFLRDRLGPAEYVRAGADLTSRGLYLDVAPWQVHVFSMSA